MLSRGVAWLEMVFQLAVDFCIIADCRNSGLEAGHDEDTDSGSN